MQAFHTMVTHPSPPAASSSNSQVWIIDSGATNHMTADLSNLSLASPYSIMKSSKLPMVKDKATRMVLYKGLCSNGLYPIPSLANVYPAAS
ncbi:hypothetical protein ACFX13_033411 [Malus domestica]